jgi:hypothetical protein
MAISVMEYCNAQETFGHTIMEITQGVSLDNFVILNETVSPYDIFMEGNEIIEVLSTICLGYD